MYTSFLVDIKSHKAIQDSRCNSKIVAGTSKVSLESVFQCYDDFIGDNVFGTLSMHFLLLHTKKTMLGLIRNVLSKAIFLYIHITHETFFKIFNQFFGKYEENFNSTNIFKNVTSIKLKTDFRGKN